jgi:hypothetical protein
MLSVFGGSIAEKARRCGGIAKICLCSLLEEICFSWLEEVTDIGPTAEKTGRRRRLLGFTIPRPSRTGLLDLELGRGLLAILLDLRSEGDDGAAGDDERPELLRETDSGERDRCFPKAGAEGEGAGRTGDWLSWNKALKFVIVGAADAGTGDENS